MTSFFNCCYLLVIVIYLQTHTQVHLLSYPAQSTEVHGENVFTAYNHTLAASGTYRELTDVSDLSIPCIETGDDFEVLLTSSLVYFV